MNPILQDILAFVHDGRQFREFRSEKTPAGRRVTYVFPSGPAENREYQCDDQTFLAWWREAEEQLREMAEAVRVAFERL